MKYHSKHSPQDLDNAIHDFFYDNGDPSISAEDAIESLVESGMTQEDASDLYKDAAQIVSIDGSLFPIDDV